MALSFGDKFAYIIIIIIIIVLLLLFADTDAISQLPTNDKERIYERKHCHVTAMSIAQLNITNPQRVVVTSRTYCVK